MIIDKPRRLTPQDMRALTGFLPFYGPQFDVTCDGARLAFCAFQGPQEGRTQPATFLGGGERGQLYVVDNFGARPTRVDLPDAHGAYSPVWSPDGRHIAVCLSDGTSVWPAIYDTQDRVLTNKGLTQVAIRNCQSQFRWVDDTTVTYLGLPAGQTANSVTIQTDAMDAICAMWPVAKQALGPTGMVFETTPAPPLDAGQAIHSLGVSKSQDLPPAVADDAEIGDFCKAQASTYPAKRLNHTDFVGYENAALATQIILRRDNAGTQIFWHKGDARSCVAQFDTFLTDIDLPTIKRVPYAPHLLLKTTQYPSDTSQPVLIEIYPDTQIKDRPAACDTINIDDLLTTCVLASSRIRLVEPSLPLTRQSGTVTNLLSDLVTQIDQVVAYVIASGLAEPDNIHLYGHSWGGWAVPMILAETDHFASGVASAGIYDLAGLQLQNDARTRFHPAPRPCLDPAYLETEFGLPQQPWQDPDAYARLSPIYQVDRINAPLLMLHGDLDYVPVTGAEAMLNALRLAGKQAGLVRYGGEDHVLSNPHNSDDYYARIAAFVHAHSPR